MEKQKFMNLGLIAILVIGIVFISGCVQEQGQSGTTKQTLSCPPSCDDGNPCTKDYCSNETGYKCVHESITPCCGNGKCESGEDYKNCISDCPKPKTTTMQPSELILDVSDFPGNYSIKERTPRLKSDVSEDAIKLGWKGGYYVRYARIGENIFDVTVIEQLISIYPIENITKVLELPRKSTENLTFEEIPCSNIGDKCRSWRITTTDEFGTQQRYYMVEFIKMDVYESFYMSGTSTDYELLIDLAEKAVDKIK